MGWLRARQLGRGAGDEEKLEDLDARIGKGLGDEELVARVGKGCRWRGGTGRA